MIEYCDRCENPTYGDGDLVNNEETDNQNEFWCQDCLNTLEF